MSKCRFSIAGALVCWFFISRQTLSGEAIRPRGVKPDLASFYEPGREFQCLDGSNTISFDQVNDDYCDCKDGSDEPGTSACPNSNFYCPNKGFKPTMIFSSRVNDGICDCCDGSDEWALDSHCTNTCEEMGAAEREEMERQAKLAEEGLKIKADLVIRGRELKEQRQNDLVAKKLAKEAAESDREAKRLVKEEAELPEKEALDRIRAEEEQIQQLKKEEQKKELEKKALTYFEKLDANQDGEVSKEEMTKEIRFDQNNDGMISDDEATFYLSGFETYNQNTFLESGWPLMSHLFESNSTDKPDVEGSEEHHDSDLEDYDYENEKAEGEENKPDDVTTERPVEIAEEEKEGTKYDEATQLLIDQATAARHLYNEADKVYRDLERELEDLEKMVEQDFGKDQEFATMVNECFEYTDLEYTYKLCAFDSCSQRPKHGGSETRLGTWEKWSGPESDPYSQMSYTKGSQCWNGPTRSVKVNLKCGSANLITAVSEPSRCEYAYVFETPAACNEFHTRSQTHDEL